MLLVGKLAVCDAQLALQTNIMRHCDVVLLFVKMQNNVKVERYREIMFNRSNN